MARLSRWCFEHRRRVVAGWLLSLVLVLGLSVALGSRFSSDFSLPGTDSQAAVTLLTKNFPAATGEGDDVVFQAVGGATVRSAAVRSAVSAALAKVARVPGVIAVGSPYGPQGGAQVSRDGTIAFATVNWDKRAQDMTAADAGRLVTAAGSASRGDLRVSLAGEVISDSAGSGPGLSVLVGVVAALVILLLVFGGAVLAALVPLLTAGIALVIATSLISLLTHGLFVPSVATDLAVLIGLGVGVDYGLFIISRHRSGLKAGLSAPDAAARSAATSGRTVLFAGATVCVALLGQFALGVSFLYGLSISAALAVALTMAASLTLLPAVLGFLGPKALSGRERAALAAQGPAAADSSAFWQRWGLFIEHRKVLTALGALAVVVAIALPVFGLRLGTSDASTDPAGSTSRQAYDTLAAGFGPGFNGPLELAAQVPGPAGRAAFGRVLAAAARTPGVASVTPAEASPNGQVLVAVLYPVTSPQAAQTVSLVNDLRDRVIPRAEAGTALSVHVGGETATQIDFSRVLTGKLPFFVAVVVLLAFLLLLAVFRSLLIPLVASVMNLLSIAAGLGALNAVFNWGWGAPVLGLSGTSPIDAFIPVLMFSVLFGLSTDYEVYLVSRIEEEWLRLGRGADRRQRGREPSATWYNHEAIVVGQAKSGEIIAAAAAIMVLVFGSFLLTRDRVLAEFGFGLGFAVLVDALVIRSLLVPAVMHLAGPANWPLPTWLDRVLPSLSVEQAS